VLLISTVVPSIDVSTVAELVRVARDEFSQHAVTT